LLAKAISCAEIFEPKAGACSVGWKSNEKDPDKSSGSLDCWLVGVMDV
jgi:hypothetical protein